MYQLEISARFSIEGARLAFHGAQSSWQVTPDRILCVGEATSESPLEDWLLCLVTDVAGNWVEGSLYSQGRNDALQWLSQALGTSLEVKLAHAPPFRSRVMWPPALQERPLFAYQASFLRRAFSRGLRWLGVALQPPIQSVHPQVVSSLWRTHRGSRSA
jgi:hypothetical protein